MNPDTLLVWGLGLFLVAATTVETVTDICPLPTFEA